MSKNGRDEELSALAKREDLKQEQSRGSVTGLSSRSY
jgi:hypothetical protein